MNKIIKFAASLLVFAGAMVSCQKEIRMESDSDVPTSFTASFEQTKVTIDGFTPKFEVGDELKVETLGGATATFACESVSETGANFKISGSWSGTPSGPYVVYRGDVALKMLAYNMINFNMPYMVIDTKASNINRAPMFAKVDDLSSGVTLLNACALLKFTVSETVKEIRLTSGSNQMSSQVSVNLANNNVIPAGATPYFSIRTYNTSTGKYEVPAGTYYIPVSPTQASDPLSGFKAGVSADGAEFTWKEKSGNITLERNKVYDLGDVADWKPAPVGPSIADFVGTYIGGVKEEMVYGGNVIVTEDKLSEQVEFVFEEQSGTQNVIMKKFFGKDCSVSGTYDQGTGTATFASGNLSCVRAPSLPIKEPLVVKLSVDKASLTQIGTALIGTGAPDYRLTLSTLTKQGEEPKAKFALEDVADYKWKLTYSVDGTDWTDEDTFTFRALTPTQISMFGGNLYGSGTGGPCKSMIFDLNLQTGAVTIPSEKVTDLVFSGIVEYDSKGDRLRVPRNLKGNVVMQFSEDKQTISVSEVNLTGNDRYSVGEKTLTNFTFTNIGAK